jgi:hypothetical protein
VSTRDVRVYPRDQWTERTKRPCAKDETIDRLAGDRSGNSQGVVGVANRPSPVFVFVVLLCRTRTDGLG